MCPIPSMVTNFGELAGNKCRNSVENDKTRRDEECSKSSELLGGIRMIT